MGFCADPTPEMGEYSVEIRRESFVLRGEDTYEGRKRHAFDLYRHECGQGSVEILIEDIPKLRAAFDQVEQLGPLLGPERRVPQVQVGRFVSPTTLEFARQWFEHEIEMLLDDPSNLLHPDRDEEPQEYFTRMRAIATDLGLDFDKVIAEQGTDFEKQRLRQIESGEVKPALTI